VDLARERRIAGKVAELRDLLDGGAVDADRTRAMLAGELETPVADDVSTTFRLPAAWIARADALTAALPAPAGGKLTRSNVLRAALDRGLSGLEDDMDRVHNELHYLSPMEEALMALDALVSRTPDNAAALDALRDQIEALSPMPHLAGIVADVAERGKHARSARAAETPPDLSGVLAELDALRARVEALTAAPLSTLTPILSAMAHGPDPLSVACPACAAVPGAPCIGRGLGCEPGSPYRPAHADRLAAVARVTP